MLQDDGQSDCLIHSHESYISHFLVRPILEMVERYSSAPFQLKISIDLTFRSKTKSAQSSQSTASHRS